MPDSDLMFRPAHELAGMVRAGELSARELVEISLARIEELNPELNAFVQVDAERALAAAEEIGPGDERPFAGVPIAIKSYSLYGGKRTKAVWDRCLVVRGPVPSGGIGISRRDQCLTTI